MIEEWDAKARAKASANSEARMENHGRVHIGHGKYMDQADIDAVALARIQPTLDEINPNSHSRRHLDGHPAQLTITLPTMAVAKEHIAASVQHREIHNGAERFIATFERCRTVLSRDPKNDGETVPPRNQPTPQRPRGEG